MCKKSPMSMPCFFLLGKGHGIFNRHNPGILNEKNRLFIIKMNKTVAELSQDAMLLPLRGLHV